MKKLVTTAVEVNIYEDFRSKVKESKLRLGVVISDLLAAWTANPELLSNAAVAADASALGVSSAQLAPDPPPSAEELQDLADMPSMTLNDLREQRRFEERNHENQLLAAAMAKDDAKVWGVAGSGAPNDPSPAAVDARSAKPLAIERERIFAERNSDLLEDDGELGIF